MREGDRTPRSGDPHHTPDRPDFGGGTPYDGSQRRAERGGATQPLAWARDQTRSRTRATLPVAAPPRVAAWLRSAPDGEARGAARRAPTPSTSRWPAGAVSIVGRGGPGLPLALRSNLASGVVITGSRRLMLKVGSFTGADAPW